MIYDYLKTCKDDGLNPKYPEQLIKSITDEFNMNNHKHISCSYIREKLDSIEQFLQKLERQQNEYSRN